jgi:hypothetical protein
MRTLRAFICYRRSDTFMPPKGTDLPEDHFIRNLRTAVVQAGFQRVFLDIDRSYGLTDSDHFEYQAFKAIEASDVFIVVIGKKWLRILNDKFKEDHRDSVAREIRMALRYEKNIVPILVDMAKMPEAEDIPELIRNVHYSIALKVKSDSSIRDLSECLSVRAQKIKSQAMFKYYWAISFSVLGLIFYYLAALNTNLVGTLEYGPSSWWGMARLWGGLFIWPAIFLPFLIFALFRPITTVVESVVYSIRYKNISAFFTYATPIFMATILSAAVWLVEVLDDRQVPWTLALSPEQSRCEESASAEKGKSEIFDVISAYDNSDELKRYYEKRPSGAPFWLTNKCWPNVLFYLVSPIYQGIESRSYRDERVNISDVFNKILDNKTRLSLGVANSKTAVAYRIAFFELGWIGVLGVVLAGFYVVARVNNILSDQPRDLPVGDAVICLAYSLITLMTWIPFRMTTEYIKFIYNTNSQTTARVNLALYIPDIMLFGMLSVGYIFVFWGLTARFRRFGLAIVGTLMVGLWVWLSVYIYNHEPDVALLSEYWQFILAISIPAVITTYVLWVFFNPTRLHFRDFRKDLW